MSSQGLCCLPGLHLLRYLLFLVDSGQLAALEISRINLLGRVFGASRESRWIYDCFGPVHAVLFISVLGVLRSICVLFGDGAFGTLVAHQTRDSSQLT